MQSLNEPCPLRGRRTAELAAGALEAVFAEVAELEAGELVLRHCTQLTANERATVLADFEIGKNVILLHMQVKMSPWTVLPLKLCGMSHHDSDIARRCMVICLAQWERASAQQKQRMHALCHTMLSRAHPLRRQVIRFIQGVPLEQLPALTPYVNALGFIPNIEIGVERLHAFVSQRVKTSHHHSPAYVSILLRRDELIRTHATECNEFAKACSLVPNHVAVVEQLNLQNHPSFAGHYGNGRRVLENTVPFSLVNKVVYRCDLPTQFRDLPPVRFLWHGDDPGAPDGPGDGGGADPPRRGDEDEGNGGDPLFDGEGGGDEDDQSGGPGGGGGGRASGSKEGSGGRASGSGQGGTRKSGGVVGENGGGGGDDRDHINEVMSRALQAHFLETLVKGAFYSFRDPRFADGLSVLRSLRAALSPATGHAGLDDLRAELLAVDGDAGEMSHAVLATIMEDPLWYL